MKKFAAILFALVITLSLSCCDSSPAEDIQAPSNVSVSNSETNSLPEESKEEEKGEDESEPEPVDIRSLKPTINETILVDEEGIKITAKSLDSDAFFGAEIKLLIENNSGENLTFQCRNSSVNGYMINSLMSVDVVNGKKANDTLTLSSSDLEMCGIDTIADMEFSFHVFNSDTWNTYLDTPQLEMKTSAYDTYEYFFDDSGDLIYNDNGIKLIIKGLLNDDSIFGPSIVVYIENNSNDNITVQTRDISINGFMIEPIFSSDVLIGKHAVDTITFFASDLEENDIAEIQDVELSFHIFDLDSWRDIVDTDVISVTF